MFFIHLDYSHAQVKTYRHEQRQKVRARRCSCDPARRAWYAHYRLIRFARRLRQLAA